MSGPETKTFTLERTLRGSPDRVWAMLTTREGLERWWAPEGFQSTVRHLDVRVGGRFEIVMTAVVPEIIAFLESIGLPPSTAARGDYTEVEPGRRLVYANAMDFVPGVSPYTTTTVIELSEAPGGRTLLRVTNGVLHDQTWTANARRGWEEQLAKLEKCFD